MEHNPIPDYSVRFDGHDMLVFTNRETVAPVPERAEFKGMVSAESYEEARRAAPGWDVYCLECEWRDWNAVPLEVTTFNL